MPSGLTFRNVVFCPQNLFMYVVYISYEIAIMSLYINILVFITKSKCAYRTGRAESSNTFQVNSRLPSITSHHMLCLYPKWFCIETDEAFSLKFAWLPELLCVNFRTQHAIRTITLGSLSYDSLPYKKITQCLRKLLPFMQTHRRTNECHSITEVRLFSWMKWKGRYKSS